MYAGGCRGVLQCAKPSRDEAVTMNRKKSWDEKKISADKSVRHKSVGVSPDEPVIDAAPKGTDVASRTQPEEVPDAAEAPGKGAAATASKTFGVDAAVLWGW